MYVRCGCIHHAIAKKNCIPPQMTYLVCTSIRTANIGAWKPPTRGCTSSTPFRRDENGGGGVRLMRCNHTQPPGLGVPPWACTRSRQFFRFFNVFLCPASRPDSSSVDVQRSPSVGALPTSEIMYLRQPHACTLRIGENYSDMVSVASMPPLRPSELIWTRTCPDDIPRTAATASSGN